MMVYLWHTLLVDPFLRSILSVATVPNVQMSDVLASNQKTCVANFVLVLPTVTFVEIVNLPHMLPISYLM